MRLAGSKPPTAFPPTTNSPTQRFGCISQLTTHNSQPTNHNTAATGCGLSCEVARIGKSVQVAANGRTMTNREESIRTQGWRYEVAHFEKKLTADFADSGRSRKKISHKRHKSHKKEQKDLDRSKFFLGLLRLFAAIPLRLQSAEICEICGQCLLVVQLQMGGGGGEWENSGPEFWWPCVWRPASPGAEAASAPTPTTARLTTSTITRCCSIRGTTRG